MREEKNNKPKKVGFFKKIFITLFLFLFLFTCVFIMLLVTRPPFFWQPFTSFMNKDKTITSDLVYTPQEAADAIRSQIRAQGFGNAQVSVTEDQLTALARAQFPELPYLTSDIKKDKLELYWVIQGNIKSEYILGQVQIKKNDQNELQVSLLGTPRVALPRFLNSSISSAALAIFTFGEDRADRNNLIAQLLNNVIGYEIKDVEFDEGFLIIDIYVDVN
ncbi:MAG: hypothetical protein Kow0081_1390 [Candidatus Dojkabacteria bacterium]